MDMLENQRMKARSVGLLRLLAAAVVLLALLVGAAHVFLSAPATRAWVTQSASVMLGVPVTLGQMGLAYQALPALQLSEVTLQTQPPLSLQHLVLRPAWGPLMQGRMQLSAVQVNGLALNQRSVDALVMLQKKKLSAQVLPGLEVKTTDSDVSLPERIDLNQVTWQDGLGQATALDGHVQFSQMGELMAADLSLSSGQFKGGRLQVRRDGPRWSVAAGLARGSINGWVAAQRVAGATSPLLVSGELQTRQLALGQLSTPTVMSGLLDADTRLSAHAVAWGDVADQLQTHSRFTVRQAVLYGVDLEKAVRTLGLSRGGQTNLDVLAGQLTTQGRSLQFSQLVASSGVLSATGEVHVSPSTALSGEVQVLMGQAALGQAVGVPLALSGTLADPQVALTRGALLGAALGTAVLPGIGTGAGAALGDRLGKGINSIFGR